MVDARNYTTKRRGIPVRGNPAHSSVEVAQFNAQSNNTLTVKESIKLRLLRGLVPITLRLLRGLSP